jgi:hypothetical protein
MTHIPILPQQSNYTIHTSQAEHQPKEQTSQKKKKAQTAMKMTTGYPDKQRKRQEKNRPQNNKSAINEKKKAATKTAQLR